MEKMPYLVGGKRNPAYMKWWSQTERGKECHRLNNQKYYKDHKDIVKCRVAIWQQKNRDKINSYQIMHRKNNPEIYRAKKRRNSAREREDLRDHYIKKLLVSNGIPPNAITPDLIELKRAQIQLLRTIRQGE